MYKTVIKLSVVLVVVILTACSKNESVQIDPPPKDLPPPSFIKYKLKELNYSGLAAPYYQFKYDDKGHLKFASFLAGILVYEVETNNGLIRILNTETAVNKDQLVYTYDGNRRVVRIDYFDSTNQHFASCIPAYKDGQVQSMTWLSKTGDIEIATRKLIFSFYEDGNLQVREELRRNIQTGVLEFHSKTEYLDYDENINTSSFAIPHDENGHLDLIPDLILQKNNPRKIIETRANFGYVMECNYSFIKGLPVERLGKATINIGNDAGRQFQSKLQYSYY